MKILFPLGMFYPTTVGGPSSSLYWHTSYLKRQSLKPYVVTTDFKLDWKKHNIKLNTWLERESGSTIYCKTKYKALPIKAIIETIKTMRKVDIVHYSSAYYYLTIYTIFIAALLRRKIVFSPRGEFFENAINSTKKKLVIKFYKTFQNRILFHATSEEEKKNIQRLFPLSNIVIQPNFVNVAEQTKSEIISRNIVFLGIIYGVKKIENLIKAVSLSKEFMKNDYKLLIAGKPLVERDFVYLDELQKLIKELNLQDKVEFIGEVFGEEKEKMLNDAYILVLPSKSENFGNVIVEAMSQSTPVIASKGTPWEILEDKNAGWWVDNAPEQLSAAIDEAYSLSNEDYLAMSRNALDLVREKYNINTSPDNHWIKIYQRLLK